jgi:hypothetical protein
VEINNIKLKKMAKYNFTVVGALLQVVLDTESGAYNPEINSYKGASTMFGNNQIYLSEFGNFRQQFYFHNIGTIGGATSTDIENANELIQELITTSSQNSSGVGSVIEYNNIDIYDTPANLPISFPANTIHGYSILAITGTLTITIGGEQTVLATSQKTEFEAVGLIADIITIDSTTGTFLVTTSKA